MNSPKCKINLFLKVQKIFESCHLLSYRCYGIGPILVIFLSLFFPVPICPSVVCQCCLFSLSIFFPPTFSLKQKTTKCLPQCVGETSFFKHSYLEKGKIRFFLIYQYHRPLITFICLSFLYSYVFS